MAKRILIICLTALALLLAGCKSQKGAISHQDDTMQWNNITVPLKLRIAQPSQLSVSGRAVMVRDSSVYISLRMLGMEMASVYVTPDSIFATQKLNRYYVAEDLNELLGSRKPTMTEIQKLLLGRNGNASLLPSIINYKVSQSDQNVQTDVNISTEIGKTRLNATITWLNSQAETDLPSPAQWKRPGSGYTRISPEQLIKMLKTL